MPTSKAFLKTPPVPSYFVLTFLISCFRVLMVLVYDRAGRCSCT
jgi:hypothetical protein